MNRSDKNIYFLRPVGAQGPVKIGSSVRPLQRLRDYQIWSPVLLELAACCPCRSNTEVYLHRHFLDTWMHGEWFAWSEELEGLISHIAVHNDLPEWVDDPCSPREWRAFIEKYPRGKARWQRINPFPPVTRLPVPQADAA